MIPIKLALIPPIAHVNSIRNTDYQLLLPQLLSNPRYVHAYLRARRDGAFMILDNGIAEGVQTSIGELHAKARMMMVNEIVVPDTLGDLESTILQAKQYEASALREFRYMGVVQGKTLAECYDCIRAFGELPYICTLGIPRHLLTTINKDARALIVAFVRRNFGWRFAVHLLGTSREYMKEFENYGQHYQDQGVRGVDTSAPYVYALAGATLVDNIRTERPDNYFDCIIADSNLAHINIQLMKGWTYGRQYTNGVR